MVNHLNGLAMMAITGQNSKPSTLDTWKHNARITSGMFQGSKKKVINGTIYETCNFPVYQSVK